MHYEVSLPLYISESYTVQFTSQYIGCYKDSFSRAFTGAQIDFDYNNSIETCVNYCGNEGKLCSFIKCKTYGWEVKCLQRDHRINIVAQAMGRAHERDMPRKAHENS